jgi:hypothetical protein
MTEGPLFAPPVPRYGESSLADILPSLLCALDVPGFPNALGIEALERACLLVIDGLGWKLLLEHAEEAPFLAAAAATAKPLTAGFPSTTATSLGSIGTGRTPGEHGLVGYTMSVPGHHRAMNTIKWALYGKGPRVGLLDQVIPEEFQPEATAFERAVADGVEMTRVGSAAFAHSGLTRAVLRGGRYAGAVSLGDLVAESIKALALGRRSLVYTYHGDLDTTGHVRGTRSEAWRVQLSHVDMLAEALASRLGSGSALVVTGDHGMVDLSEEERVDLDTEPDLAAGVRLLGGEARARHVYTAPGAERDVLETWRSLLGDRMWIRSRSEAIESGWFGPFVPDPVRARIGNVVAAAFAKIGIMQAAVDGAQARFVGHHGSMTPEEQLVPLLVIRR